MRRLAPALLLASLMPLAAAAAWLDGSGKPIPDTESMRSDGDFHAQLLITPDEAELRKAWNTSGRAPTLRVADSVKRGISSSAMLFLRGCAPNASGQCDVVVEFFVITPSGQRVPAGGGPLWTSEPPPATLVLGSASMNFSFGPANETGLYSVQAKVVDRIGKRTLELWGRIRLD
ncbi:hypothetical protein M2282_005119 [Variovorax boronicumulans]|uniref:hypothetical protein n=1 Tax=Variovorax boronicumulans TaxID=436515 RepID=UPI0024747043|nr:hypothetical protein [Variovorax boronicumulans]MDH6169949.1 hypothetical protein [Variovorax boronicumulans]